MAGNANKTNWNMRLVAELKRDKKKTCILGVLFLVAIIVGGKLIMNQSPPAKASAAIPGNSSAVNATEKDHSGGNDASMSDAPLQQGHGAARREYIPPSKITISRDLFVPNDEYFPIAHPVKTSVSKVTSQTSTQPSKDSMEAIRAGVLAQAKALSLQCTIDGPQPAAIINQSMLRQGEWINGFKIVKITTRECTLEKKGVTVVLSMRDVNGN